MKDIIEGIFFTAVAILAWAKIGALALGAIVVFLLIKEATKLAKAEV